MKEAGHEHVEAGEGGREGREGEEGKREREEEKREKRLGNDLVSSSLPWLASTSAPDSRLLP